MSLSDKALLLKEDFDNVHDAGKKEEQRAFWETYQKGGSRTNYQYAFAYEGCWTDETYNPIYPIRIPNTNVNMYYESSITNTKVTLDASGRTLTYTFRSSLIETIPELKVNESTDLNNGFTGCTKLKNIKITGTLAKSVTMNTCPLTVESMKNIILALKDYSGTDNEGKYSVVFSSVRNDMLDAEGNTSPNGNTWRQYANDLGWIC